MPPVRRWSPLFIGLFACLLLSSLSYNARAADSYTVYLPALITGRTLNVASGVAPGDGSSTNPFNSINAAVAQAKPGDTILVRSGVYLESVSIDSIDGTAQQPITLLAQKPVRIQSPDAHTTLSIARKYWTVRGFDITPNNQAVHAAEFTATASNSTLDDCHLFDGLIDGVNLDDGSQYNTVSNSVIENFNQGEKDAHGVAIKLSNYNLIQGNTISNTSGDAVQINTSDNPELSAAGARAIGNRIIGNTMHDSRENAVDVKSSEDTLIEGNTMWGYKPSTTSDGMAITVHYWSRSVTITNNIIFNSNWGIEVSRGEKNGVIFANVPDNVTISKNYIHDTFSVVGQESNRGNGAGIVVREANNVKVWNNTITTVATTCMVVTWPNPSEKNPAPGAPTNLQIKNNSFSGCGEAEIFLRNKDGLKPTDWLIDFNHYGSAVGGTLAFGSKLLPLLTWQSDIGYDQHSLTTLGSGIVTARFLPEASLVDHGTDVGLPFCGSAPDIGAFESCD